MEATQRKGSDRGDKLGLGILFVVTAIIIVLNASQISHLNATRDDYAATHSYTNAVYNSLDDLFQEYVLTHTYTNTEYDALYATYLEYVSTYNSTHAGYTALLAAYEEYIATHTYTNTEYNALNATYHAYVSTHSYTNTEYDVIENERDELRDIVELEISMVWVENEAVSQPARSYSEWTFSTQYAGYVSVNVVTSTTDKTFVQVVYSAYGVNYDVTIDVGNGGMAVFPVLPTDDLQVRVGNTNWIMGATETVIITHCY